MGSLFSKKEGKPTPAARPKGAEVTSKDRAVLDLKNARDRLKKYRKKIEMESGQLTEKAKQLIVEQKRDRALLVLKLRRHKEKAVVNIDGQLMSILEMIDNVEWEYANMEVLKALKAGNAALNSLHQEMSIDDVENLLAETNEAIETENQINLLLAGQFNAQDDVDLQRELAMLMGEDAESEAKVEVQQKVSDLPSVPTSEVVTSNKNTATDISNLPEPPSRSVNTVAASSPSEDKERRLVAAV